MVSLEVKKESILKESAPFSMCENPRMYHIST